MFDILYTLQYSDFIPELSRTKSKNGNRMVDPIQKRHDGVENIDVYEKPRMSTIGE